MEQRFSLPVRDPACMVHSVSARTEPAHLPAVSEHITQACGLWSGIHQHRLCPLCVNWENLLRATYKQQPRHSQQQEGISSNSTQQQAPFLHARAATAQQETHVW